MPPTLSDLVSIGAEVVWSDHDAEQRTHDALAADRALGRLADLAEWISAVQGASPPSPLNRVRAVVFGPPGRYAEQVAASVQASVRAVQEFGSGTTEDAVAAGAAVADDEVDSGADLLVAALPDTGVLAAVVASVLTDTEPVKVLAGGAAATDPDAWMARAVAVRDARRRAFALRTDPQQLLAVLGSPALAATTGFVLRAAARRTPVLLDGPAATAAALVAYEAQPRGVRWWLSADLAPDPAHELALNRLGGRAVLDLGTGLGDGTAGLLAVAVLRAAIGLAR